MFNKQDYLKIMHLNIRSIKSATKQTQLKHQITKHNPDIISLNETYLTTESNMTIEGFNIIRADRIGKKGGGAAICIRSTLDYREIYLGDISGRDDACGLTITSANRSIAIFSIYSPPKAPLNQTLFTKIINNHKNFIITGDLNGQNKLWHCKKENKYGRELETLINRHNIQILNNNSITYPRGKSILDLTLTSTSLSNHRHSFTVLNDQISDHQPTITTLSNMRCTKKKIHFNKTDWKKYEEILSKSDFKTEINSIAELDLAASGLTTTIQNACTAATKSITIMTKPKCFQSIPDELLRMIKYKRKINRSLAKKHSTELRKTYNALTSKIKISLTKLKSENLKTNFLQLEKFKSSSAKHWKLLNALNNPHKEKKHQAYFTEENQVIDTDAEIAEKFAAHLYDIFGVPTPINTTAPAENNT